MNITFGEVVSYLYAHISYADGAIYEAPGYIEIYLYDVLGYDDQGEEIRKPLNENVEYAIDFLFMTSDFESEDEFDYDGFTVKIYHDHV